MATDEYTRIKALFRREKTLGQERGLRVWTFLVHAFMHDCPLVPLYYSDKKKEAHHTCESFYFSTIMKKSDIRVRVRERAHRPTKGFWWLAKECNREKHA